MKAALIFTLSLAVVGLVAYFGYFFISPNITVVNSSSEEVSKIVVALPGSRLDFGALEPGAENTIYYSISQADGAYTTSITTASGVNMEKSCGSVTNNEFHKRVRITLTAARDLICEGA